MNNTTIISYVVQPIDCPYSNNPVVTFLQVRAGSQSREAEGAVWREPWCTIAAI